MALSDKRKSSTKSAKSSKKGRRTCEFGDNKEIIGEIFVLSRGKNKGQISHVVRHKDHFWMKLSLDFIDSLEQSGVSWGAAVSAAYQQVDAWLADDDLMGTLRDEFGKAGEATELDSAYEETTGGGGLAARCKRK